LLGSLGLSLPASLEPTFTSITGANTVLSLMLLGMFLSVDRDPAGLKRSASVLFLRYGTGLLVGGAVFLLLPISFEVRRSILLAMLLPVGLTVMPYSIRFGLDRRLAANVATAGVIVSFFIMLAIFSLL
ncbi:MAG: transporter, partial [Spirochaetia bacterium]